jgi:hypothetical protein
MTVEELQKLAFAIGRTPKQVGKWIERGRVPHRYRLSLFREARREGRELVDADFELASLRSFGRARP